MSRSGVGRYALYLLGLSVGCVSCASDPVRGAEVRRPGHEPPGQVLGRYKTSGCVDAARAPAERPTAVYWVRASTGREFLVETLSGHDSLVVSNSFTENGERIFQAALQTEGGLLADYRLPLASHERGAAGRMTLVRAWDEVPKQAGGFRAYFERGVLTCRLEPQAAPASAQSRAVLAKTSAGGRPREVAGRQHVKAQVRER